MNLTRLTSLLVLLAGVSSGYAKDRYFADGLKLEAEIQGDAEHPSLTITRYDDAWEATQLLYADLTPGGDGKFKLTNESTDREGKERSLTGTVKIINGALIYEDLKDSAGKLEIPASGGPWKELDEATYLNNVKSRYEAADGLLNEAWKQARAEVGEKGLADLKEAQRSWLKYRDSMAERMTRNMQPEEAKDVPVKSLPDYWQSMTSFTVDRTSILKVWSGKKVPPGRAGIYRDSFSGEVTLEETKDGLQFEINVVRTAAFNVGDVSGVAKLEGETATWTDAPKPQGDKAAVLKFKFNPDRSLTVESENADSYHGHNAHFDGRYFKVAPLPKKEEAKPAKE